MTNPLGLSLELPRKGSRMTAVYDPSLGSFLLAEQMRSGKVVIHERLYQANVNVAASTGVADGRGHYGYVLYFRPEEFEKAAAALEL